MTEAEKKKELVSIFFEKGILLNPDVIDTIPNNLDFEMIIEVLSSLRQEDLAVINNELMKAIENKNADFNWDDLARSRVDYEKNRDDKVYNSFVSYIKNSAQVSPPPPKEIANTSQESQSLENSEKLPAAVEEAQKPGISVVSSYQQDSKKRDIQDFVAFFNHRYKALEKLLRNRHEMRGLLSTSRVKMKKDKENVSVIGMVFEKHLTKNGNIMLTVEDPSGTIKVLVNKNKPELYEKASSIVEDEVIGIVGVGAGNIIFSTNIVWPEIPLNRPVKKASDEVYAVFVSDFHVGSDHFLEEEFNKFIDWISAKTGNEEQRRIASKVKYLFIVGDLVDGCGIYPGQEDELVIRDIYKQYEVSAEYLRRIPSNIQIVICPGNHDAMRIAEPQPELYKDFASAVWELPNVTMVSNPAVVNIHSSPGFPGFDVLLYHGYSFDYYVENVEHLRNNGGYKRADLIMKFLLRRRHLAPTHKSTLYIPDAESDPLVISTIPDFFVTGHIHYSIAASYHNVTTICCSCWQEKTPFQEKVGHEPQPARVPIVNLNTRKVKILKFGK
ncbi:DNA-directed DNA polymerase II small subunit [Candidatus Woesearchaeota archaeon]|nr:DNA-directed DNA polymerase II small subunit [Candidatus Woesearchaeota archaeon]